MEINKHIEVEEKIKDDKESMVVDKNSITDNNIKTTTSTSCSSIIVSTTSTILNTTSIISSSQNIDTKISTLDTIASIDAITSSSSVPSSVVTTTLVTVAAKKKLATPEKTTTAPTTVDTIVKVKPKKKKKSKIKRDALHPKHPLTGYVRYMNVRREELRKEYPTLTAVDITKMIGEEWSKLAEDKKKPFLDAAEIDKERFHKEIKVYKKKLEADAAAAAALLSESAVIPNGGTNETSTGIKSKDSKKNNSSITNQQNKFNNNGNAIVSAAAAVAAGTQQFNSSEQSQIMLGRPASPTMKRIASDYDIPIFTDEFLDHNKMVDSELRLLRKSNIDLEQQNSVLEKHVENMQNGINKVDSEISELNEKNEILEKYLEKLRKKLSTSLASLSIPGEPNGATMDNIDKYMSDLYQMATSNSHGPASLNKAKDIIRKLDIQM